MRGPVRSHGGWHHYHCQDGVSSVMLDGVLELFEEPSWRMWIVEGKQFWMKRRMGANGWDLLLSDLKRVWVHQECQLQRNFARYNEAKGPAEDSRISSWLWDEEDGSHWKLVGARTDTDTLHFKLNIKQRIGMLLWEMEFTKVADSGAVLQKLLYEPLMVSSAELSRQFVALYDLARRKDAEIAAYQQLSKKKVAHGLRTEILRADEAVNFFSESISSRELQHFIEQPHRSSLTPLVECVMSRMITRHDAHDDGSNNSLASQPYADGSLQPVDEGHTDRKRALAAPLAFALNAAPVEEGLGFGRPRAAPAAAVAASATVAGTVAPILDALVDDSGPLSLAASPTQSPAKKAKKKKTKAKNAFR